MATKQKTAVLEDAAQFLTVKTSAVSPHPDNPRRDVGDISELAADIKARGLDHPLVVVPAPTAGKYVIVAGHRRFAACKEAGLSSVLVRVRPDWDLRQQRTVMLSENLHRTDLSPIEEAAGYQQLLDLDLSVDEVAATVSRSATTVRSRVSLLGLPERAKEGLHAREFTLEDALSLEQVEDADLREMVAETLGTRDFEWKLKEVLRKQTNRRELSVLIKDLRDRGFTVLEKEPESGTVAGINYGTWYYRADEVKEVLAELPKWGGLSKTLHETYHGDPAGVTWGLWLDSSDRFDVQIWLPVTDEDEANSEAEGSAEARAEKERLARLVAEQEAARAAVVAEADTAYELRSAWLQGRVARKFTAKETAALLDWFGRQAVLDHFAARDTLLCEWGYDQSLADFLGPQLEAATGVTEKRDLPEDDDWSPEDVSAVLAAATGVTGQAVLLSYIANEVEPSQWSRADNWLRASFEMKAYYELLIELGYQPSSAEVERLGLQGAGE